MRDYIHVVDLARGHLAALGALTRQPGVLTVNLGTGRGYSVLEVIAAFERASGRKVPYASSPGGRAILRSAMPIRRWRTACWAGWQSAASTRCATIRGAGRSGRRRTPATEFRANPPGAQ